MFYQQIKSLKQNWLFFLLIILAILMTAYLPQTGIQPLNMNMKTSMGQSESLAYDSAIRSFPPSPISEGFSPETANRIVSVHAYLTTEIKRGTFQEKEKEIKTITTTAKAFLIHASAQTYDVGRKSYQQGNYEIKVPTKNYATTIQQLKHLGEVQSFSEDTLDITGTYVNHKETLAAEKTRLQRYRNMYTEAEKIEDKLQLNDRIFNQERTIQFLEETLTNIDQKVDYSTISLTLKEKESTYANTTFVTLSALLASFFKSINTLITLIITLIPWAILIWLGKRFYKKRR